MSNNVDNLELRGFEFLKREQWAAARQCFEEMRCHALPPLREAKVLANIMLTYERDGLNEAAASAAHEGLTLLQSTGSDQTMEGTSLAGRFNGHAARLLETPRSVVMLAVGRKLIPLALAYYFGAMLGAYVGRSTAWTIIGAIGGFFVLSRYFSGVVGGSLLLSAIGCCLSLAALYKLLVVEASSAALFLGVAVLPLVLLFSGFALSARPRR